MSEVPQSEALPVGKLPAADLRAALASIDGADPRLIVGPRVGEDAAVVEMDTRRLVFATDPITFAIDRIGWYAVHVNANDIAVMGARPLWFLATVLMPEGSTRSAAREVIDDIATTCREMGISLAGGHTEITAGLPRPIVVGQMIGEATAESLVTKAGLRPGDLVVLTHGAAIEGTALLARERGQTLEARVGPALLARARQLLFSPGISVLPAARVAARACRLHAMHDPTEGGVLTGLHELAEVSGLGLRARADDIPVLAETAAICRALDADPLFLIASGSLLAAVAGEDAPRLIAALEAASIPAAVVAEVRPPEEGILVERGGRWSRLEPPARDEIARVLEGMSRGR